MMPRQNFSRMKWLALCLVIVLASCGSAGPSSSGSSAPTSAISAAPTDAPAQPRSDSSGAPGQSGAPAPPARPTPEAAPTQAPDAATEAPAAPTASGRASAGTFVVPKQEQPPTARRTLPGAVYEQPNIQQEAQSFFELFYQARSLQRGGALGPEALSQLVEGAYADYTLPLFDQDVQDARAGKLVAVNFSGLAVAVDEWQSDSAGLSGTALVTVTRTRAATRSDRSEAPQTATYQFRLKRAPADGGGVIWTAIDFFNPVTKRWVSEPEVGAEKQIADEIQSFFDEFYAARTLAPGGSFDFEKTTALTQLSYRDYTLPLLQRQQDEVNAGKLIAVSYTDLKVQVLNYDPVATNHGGIATVQVTRTSHVRRPGGDEPPQTGVYQFRLHRHMNESGRFYWLAVDFKQPEVGRWVSEIAGMSVPVPASGYG